MQSHPITNKDYSTGTAARLPVEMAWLYPHTFVHADALHAIVSRKKEAVEVLRVSLPS